MMANPATTSVFGQRQPKGVAQQILDNPTLNATPSPTNPQEVPSHSLLAAYRRLTYACYEALDEEKDPTRLSKLADIKDFAESSVSDLELRNRDELSGAPAPTPTPPAPPHAMGPPPATPATPPGAQMGSPAPAAAMSMMAPPPTSGA